MKEKRVLLVRVGMLGDTIWGMAPINKLLKYYGPDSTVDIVVKKGMGGLFKHDPRVGRVFEIRKRKLPLFLSPTKLQILWHSVRHPYELALDMETRPFSELLFRLLRARKKILARAIRDDIGAPTEHAVESIRKITRLALPKDLADAVTPTLVAPTSIDRRSLLPIEGPYICLHFGNSWIASGRKALRAWPSEYWRQLLLNWEFFFPGHTPVAIGTASEKTLAASITAGIKGYIDLCGKTDVPGMMAVIAGADALIGTDTGPSHMAAAFGTPVVAVFGPTQQFQTGPFADGQNCVEILSAAMLCRPCVRTPAFERCQRNRCMEAITPAMVAASAQRLIQLRRRGSDMKCTSRSR
ncbi:glycosyltransferase family 9 protein [Paraburkholderia lycopersici]|uniref:Heptosyltransferase-2 n=1 Tax=Paraburkholderia lycopersici TaxID=416944 RepID=A0A1G6MW63_9BURK|nr:glycosyltransferase family 9 protein [Paraburkholderia lycopersici]SDC59780.1 heptosyltransferase-2 [Paraburkholderia lycopersici]